MDSSSGWHSITPWTGPQLALSVREITSVSATFILSSSDQSDPSLQSLGLSDSEDDDAENDLGNDKDDDSLSGKSRRRRSVISNALAKGLSVNVNGSTWKRVIIRMDDACDEAIIIIYGLLPGRQYDIDLGLVQGGQNNNIHRQVVTDDPTHSHEGNGDIREDTSAIVPVASSSSTLSTPGAPTAYAETPGPQPTLEERLVQLQQMLSNLNTEKESITVSLKSARRDAQKADSALRTEIDVLKRASEKHASTDTRARQKVLALQEAGKRAQAATAELEELLHEVESSLPDLRRSKDEKECLYTEAKTNAEIRKNELRFELEKERKHVEGLRADLVGLGNRLEKMHSKKEKLEVVMVPDLEEQLKELQREIKNVEAESVEAPSISSVDDEPVDGGDRDVPSLSPPFEAPAHQHPSMPRYTLLQRKRSQPSIPTLSSPASQVSPSPNRPPPAPIQRPNRSQAPSKQTQPQSQLTITPNRSNSLKATSTSPQTKTLQNLSGVSGAMSSPLSRTALPFEPRQPIRAGSSPASSLDQATAASLVSEPFTPIFSTDASGSTMSGPYPFTPLTRPAGQSTRGRTSLGHAQDDASRWRDA